MTSPLPIKQLYSKSLAISPLILYTIVMLKERNGKTDRLHQKITKSFEKALDIKYRIRAVVRFYAFFILHRKERKALSFAQVRRGLLRNVL